MAGVPVPEQYRLTQLIKLTGWTLPEIDDAPADTLDWILAINATEVEVENQKRAEANRAR